MKVLIFCSVHISVYFQAKRVIIVLLLHGCRSALGIKGYAGVAEVIAEVIVIIVHAGGNTTLMAKLLPVRFVQACLCHRNTEWFASLGRWDF